jgi:nucleotide-binding universal stress UspA family protein
LQRKEMPHKGGGVQPETAIVMFDLSRVLLPIDFSERSIDAAHHATALACRFHSELHIVHVIDLRVYGVYGVINVRDALTEFAPGCQEEAVREVENFLADEFRNLRVLRHLLYGDPAREIVKYGAAQNINLIVMATHGRSRFRRFLLGSVTAKVLHDTDLPVWTGAHMQEAVKAKSFGCNRILCAIDPSNHDHTALAWAWQFGREVGAQVMIVHALPSLYVVDPYFGAEAINQMRIHAQTEISRAQSVVGSQADVEIVVDEVPVAVRNLAREWKADLVVISRGKQTGTLGRLRSRSYGIIRESPCPVVSV